MHIEDAVEMVKKYVAAKCPTVHLSCFGRVSVPSDDYKLVIVDLDSPFGNITVRRECRTRVGQPVRETTINSSSWKACDSQDLEAYGRLFDIARVIHNVFDHTVSA